MDSTDSKLIAFVRTSYRSRARAFELLHCTEQGLSLVRRFEADTTTDPVHIALELFQNAMDHADSFPMAQRYVVQAFLEHSSAHCGEFSFNLAPSRPRIGLLAGAAEMPTEKGLMGQLMRHNEAGYATIIELYRSIATMYQAKAEIADASFHRYIEEKERWSARSAEEAERAHIRRMQADEAERDHEIIQEGMEALRPLFKALGPHLARNLTRFLDSITGRDAPPSPGAASGRAAPSPPSAPSGSAVPSNSASPPSPAAPSPPPAEPITERAPQAKAKEAEKPSKEDTIRERRRRRLEDILHGITEEEATKLEQVLGQERAGALITAVVEIIQ